jgi:hypothetical protein
MNDKLKSEIRNVAKKIAHHGPDNLIETIRQRCKVKLDRDLAESLCKEFNA